MARPYHNDCRDWDGTTAPPLAGFRPQWPGMLDASDLTPGRMIRRHGPGGSNSDARVVSAPVDGKVTLSVPRYVPEDGEYETTAFLGDMGMVPYSGDLWNPTNYVTAVPDA